MGKHNQNNRNEWYPLPPDYPRLSEDGKKEARLAVIRDHSSVDSFVRAWAFFRNMYLRTAGRSFYRTGFSPSPQFHYEAVADLYKHARNMLAAPRGFAKSTVIGLEIPLFLSLAYHDYSIGLCLASDKLVETRFDILMEQLTDNPNIIADFGCMKPKRGTATWNHHYLHLNNGSVIQGFSVEGRKRGARPRLMILDDPEFDTSMPSGPSSARLLVRFEYLLFNVLIPMLEHGSAAFWIGTILNRRSFLFHACYEDDPRFAYWNRKVLAADMPQNPDNPDEKVALLWPERWPAEVLAARRAEIGEVAYAAEYRNSPISENDRQFKITEQCEYSVSIDPLIIKPSPSNPVPLSVLLTGNYPVTYTSCNPDNGQPAVITTPSRELLGGMFRILLFDFAAGLSTTNDYSCIVVAGFDRFNVLWVLDMWMGRAREPVLLRNIFDYGRRWRVRVIGIESISIQIQLVESVSAYLNTAGGQSLYEQWIPRVLPIRYPPGMSKADRIAGLGWRFSTGRIKYPAYLRGQWPFSALYDQTTDYTYDMAFLRFDDAIDTVAMSQYAVHTPPDFTGSPSGPAEPPTLVERIRTDTPLVPGLPVLSGYSASELTREELKALIDKRLKSIYTESEIRYPPALRDRELRVIQIED